MLRVKTTEFSIGIGPPFFLFQKKEHGFLFKFLPFKKNQNQDTNYTPFYLRIFPFLGYVSFFQKNNGQIIDFLSLEKPWKRIIIEFFGPLGNFLFAIFLTGILLFQNAHQPITVVQVFPNSIAQQIGISPSDKIFSIDHMKNPSLNKFVHNLKTSQKNCVIFGKNSPSSRACFQLKKNQKLGIEIEGVRKQTNGLFSLIPKSIVTTGTITKGYLSSIFSIFQHHHYNNLSGPVGMINSMQSQVFNFNSLLSLLIMINLGLALTNLLLPNSITDGGRILMDLIAILLKKNKIEIKYLDFLSVIFIVFIFIIVTFKDLLHVFS